MDIHFFIYIYADLWIYNKIYHKYNKICQKYNKINYKYNKIQFIYKGSSGTLFNTITSSIAYFTDAYAF